MRRGALWAASWVLLAATAAHAEPAKPDAPKTERRRSHVHAAWTFTAIGGAALLGSITLAYVASGRYDDAFADGHCYEYPEHRLCDPVGYQQTSQARTMGLIATGGGIAGWGLLATGLIVYVTAPRDRVVVSPAVGANETGLVVAGRF
jgi:hypothetical protein